MNIPGAMFSPVELVIGPSTSAEEYQRIGKAICSIGNADDLWKCDFALWGMNKFGSDDGLQLASDATGLSKTFLKRSARIAERFGPSRRFPNMTREHYRGLCCFPVEWLDTWLPTVAEKGFGARTLRALAVEAFGSDPKAGYAKNKKRSVALPETLFARLKECSPIPKVAVFVEQILLDFVTNSTPEQKSRIAAALSTRDLIQHQRRRDERNAKNAEKIAAKEKRDAARKAERDKQEAEKAAQITARKAAQEQLRAKRSAERAASHCNKIASYTESLGKPSRWPTKSEADELIKNDPHLESYACECGQFHIRRADPATDEPRPTYAERRAAQREAVTAA
jgi:hypothetical protein